MKMPNHIFNTIKFKKEDREKFAKFMEEDRLDFNKLVPMPQELNEMGGDCGEKKEIVNEWKEFTKEVQITPANVDEYIEKFRNEVRENPEKYPESAKSVNLETTEREWGGISVPDFQYQMYRIAGKVKYGFSSWYYWSIANWGTKWNAYETEFDEEYLYFKTAWDTPLPIFEKMASLNPDTWFQVKYCDEATGRNCGIVEYKPNFFPSENEDNMAVIKYDNVTEELEIVETEFFENSEDAPEKFNAIIEMNTHGTLILYNDSTDFKRFINKLTPDQEKKYYEKWYVFAGGNLEDFEEE